MNELKKDYNNKLKEEIIKNNEIYLNNLKFEYELIINKKEELWKFDRRQLYLLWCLGFASSEKAISSSLIH